MNRNAEFRIPWPVVVWMAGALFSFVGAALSIRLLSYNLNVFEINVVRTGGGLIIVLALILLRPALLSDIRLSDAVHHIPRNLAHVTGGLLWTAAIATLPLATVFALEFTAPAWAGVLAYFILGERLTMRKAVGILLSLVGVFVIVRPSPSSFDVMAVLPLGAALCFALSALLTRKLVLTKSVFAILFWMMVMQLPINIAGALLAPLPSGLLETPDRTSVVAMILLPVSGLLTQYCLSKALSHGEAITVVPLDFLRVPLIAVLGWLYFGEAIEIAVITGTIIIVTGVIYGLAGQSRPAQPDTSKNGVTLDENRQSRRKSK